MKIDLLKLEGPRLLESDIKVLLSTPRNHECFILLAKHYGVEALLKRGTLITYLFHRMRNCVALRPEDSLPCLCASQVRLRNLALATRTTFSLSATSVFVQCYECLEAKLISFVCFCQNPNLFSPLKLCCYLEVPGRLTSTSSGDSLPQTIHLKIGNKN
jgi:hypothetical protein